MDSKPTVFIVDDEPAIRQSLRWLIGTVGLAVETYSSAQEFLDTYEPDRPGCLLLDVRLPGVSGLELQEKLASRGSCIPIIMITGFGEVAPAVTAMKAGAVDFIEKPFNDQMLLDRVQEAVALDVRRRSNLVKKREVMAMVVSGHPNKVIAARMHLSPKTVEAHRAQVMKKMRAESLPHLVRYSQQTDTDMGFADRQPPSKPAFTGNGIPQTDARHHHAVGA